MDTDHAPHAGHDHEPVNAHAHSHVHGHNHGHAHAPKDFGRAFAVGIALNIAFVVAESIAGIVANSTALLADAGHNLSDVLGLAVAWVGAALSKRAASPKFPFGFGRSTILAALINAMLLLVAAGAIGWEVFQRIMHPEPVQGAMVMIVAGIGILINGVTAWLFASGSEDINIRGAYLHMAADAAVSAGVVIAGLLSILTGWLWIDPLVSLIILIVIIIGTWGLLRDSVALSLDAAPRWIDLSEVQILLETQPGVARVEDLRVRPASTTTAALTARLIMPEGQPADAFFRSVRHLLEERHKIAHVTIQIERGS